MIHVCTRLAVLLPKALMTQQTVPEWRSCLLLLTLIGLLTAHTILLNKQAATNAAHPSLHREQSGGGVRDWPDRLIMSSHKGEVQEDVDGVCCGLCPGLS